MKKYILKVFSSAWIASLLCKGTTYNGVNKIVIDINRISNWLTFLITIFALIILFNVYDELK